VQVVWYTAMSIDGRIAGPGEDMSFLDTVKGDGEERDFDDLIAGVDAIVIGGGTLRWLHGQGHDLPLRGLPIWLVSHDDELAARAAAADPSGTPVTRVEGDLAEILDAVAAAGHNRAWLGGGGDIAGQALAADRSHRPRCGAGRIRPPRAAAQALQTGRVPRVRAGLGQAALGARPVALVRGVSRRGSAAPAPPTG
jgi:dihydrofolate reductase